MTPKHLSTERLLALYRGDIGDIDALEHLASCPECRRAFDDSRWAMLLGRLPKLVASFGHSRTQAGLSISPDFSFSKHRMHLRTEGLSVFHSYCGMP